MSQGADNGPLVYLTHEGVIGRMLKQYGPYGALIEYEVDGIRFEVVLLEEDFEVIRELDFGLSDYE